MEHHALHRTEREQLALPVLESIEACRKQLPAFMVPMSVQWRDSLPRNPNGKYDRPKLAAELKGLFGEKSA